MLLPPTPPLASKSFIVAPKASLIMLKWGNFADESLKFNQNNQYGIHQHSQFTYSHIIKGNCLDICVARITRVQELYLAC